MPFLKIHEQGGTIKEKFSGKKCFSCFSLENFPMLFCFVFSFIKAYCGFVCNKADGLKV